MRIRKRQAVAEAETTLPISWKYQKLMERALDMEVSPGSCGDVGTVCKGATQNHGDGVRRPESQLHGDCPQKQEHPLLKQEGCGGDSEKGLPEFPKENITDKHRLKRRKLKHEFGSGKSNVTSGDTQTVTDMVTSVSNRTQNNLGGSLDRPAKRDKVVKNSKDALVSSIFYVFEAAGENGLTASEVVKIMTEQALPGLKEGGARHTVQVANVLRSSLSFISLGNKRYHLCSSLDPRSDPGRQGRHGRQQKSPKEAPGGNTSQEIKPVHRARQSQAIKSSGSSKLGTAGDTSRHATTQPSTDVNLSKPDTNSMLEGGDKDTDVVKPRRRGPLVSQKDKGRTQCKRYDGRGWQCSRLTEPGYSLCVHHQDLINKRAAKLKEAQGSGKVIDRSLLMRVKIAVDSDGEGADYEEINDPMATLNGDSVPAVPVQKQKMLFLTAIK